MSILQRLELHDFRNYEALRLDLEPGINVFVGANGQGKTNLLEAAYYLSILRSFRSQQVRHLCRWDCSGFVVRGVADGRHGRLELGVQHGPRGRRLRRSGANLARASDFIGHLFCVAFIPEDIDLVKGAAGGRRRYLDVLLSQLDPTYLTALQDYARALKSRNSLLRRPQLQAAAVRAFDQVLVDRGTSLMNARDAFFTALQPHLQHLCGVLFQDADAVRLAYQPSIAADSAGSATEVFRQRLTETLQRDVDRGHTQIGPHRDDFTMFLRERPLQHFGSEGQCRKTALLLKMAAAQRLAEEQQREPPILLVDDVIGELDPDSRAAFCEMLTSGAQVFFATTELAALGELQPAAVFRVSAGEVAREAGPGE